MTVYATWLTIGFMSVTYGVYLVGGTGAALITFGCGMMSAGYLGIRNNA